MFAEGECVCVCVILIMCTHMRIQTDMSVREESVVCV